MYVMGTWKTRFAHIVTLLVLSVSLFFTHHHVARASDVDLQNKNAFELANRSFSENNVIIIDRETVLDMSTGQNTTQYKANVYTRGAKDPSSANQAVRRVNGVDYWYTGSAGSVDSRYGEGTNGQAYKITFDEGGAVSPQLPQGLRGTSLYGEAKRFPDGTLIVTKGTVTSTDGFEDELDYKHLAQLESLDSENFVGPLTPEQARLVGQGAGGTTNTVSSFGCRVFSSSWGSLSFDTTGFARCIVWVVYNIIAWPISILLSIAAKFFNFAFSASIGIKNGAADPAMFNDEFIRNAWVAVRDLINITFIFALLEVAIKLIIGKGSGYQDRLKNIIIAAIFINFSYFIVTEIIYLFNALTTAIFYQIASSGNLADGFTAATGISKFGSLAPEIARLVVENPVGLTFYLLFSSVLMVIFIVVLLFSTAMFITRYIALMLCVIFSPVLFLGMIVPGASGKSKELETTLKGQILFPVIYLIMIWLSINFINITGASTDITQISVNSLTEFAETSQAIIFRFAVATALLIASLTVSKKYSTMGSSLVGAAQKWTGKTIGTVAFGGAALAGRTVVGGVGGRIAQDVGGHLAALEGSNRIARAIQTPIRAVGRGMFLAGDKARNSTFDVRNSSTAQRVASTTIGDYGTPSKKTYNSAVDERAKAINARAKQYAQPTVNETTALNKADAARHKARDAAGARFKEQHKKSADDFKKEMVESQKNSKELREDRKMADEAAKKSQEKFESHKKLVVENLVAAHSTLKGKQQAGTITAGERTQMDTMSKQIQMLRSGDKLEQNKVISTLNNKDLREAHNELRKKEAEVNKIIGMQTVENRKYKDLREKYKPYEEEIEKIDKDYEAKEKELKKGSKARRTAYENTLKSRLRPHNYIYATPIQRAFAAAREEAASKGKKGK